MDERRLDYRILVNTPARLYHSVLGRIDGVISDISDGGASIKLNSFINLNKAPVEETLLMRPINQDVLYPVSCVRQNQAMVGLQFLE